MRVLICPDKFAGTLSAPEVAAAVAEGWLSAAPTDEIVSRPLSDGGPGFVDVLAEALPGRLVPVETVDPLGRATAGAVLVVGDTAYVESAQACGLHLVEPAERDVRRATSYGLGVLVTHAVESGARTVVVGLGGSATNDGGAGMLAALGHRRWTIPGTRCRTAGRPLSRSRGWAARRGCAVWSWSPPPTWTTR
ncbi:hypothetical protein Phou_098650 [Phytohabitans houttuyneae]|uniref:Glycerate kinase n=1 Tax=Phytohabitans houttuyneae TaxID=1076126 RepID=A0A6V8KYU6_9ACTN|nr:hypothetical protein Phou_098650 [Phytohabitans houttuyneae]